MCNPTSKPTMLDEWSGRYFEASMDDVQRAANECNAIMLSEGVLDLNTFYDHIGLPPLPMGRDFGWSNNQLHVLFGSIVMPNGWPALALSFRRDPKPDLGQHE